MAYETVKLIGGANGIDNIESFSAVDGVSQIPPRFSINVTEMGPFGDGSPFTSWDFPPGTQVTIEASGDTFMSGLVETYAPAFDANTHSVQIEGAGTQREYIRSAVQHPTGYFENQSILQIAQTLAAPYGLIVQAMGTAGDRAAEVIRQFQTRKGSTLWDEMNRMLPQRGMTTHGSRQGTVDLMAGTTGNHAGGLIQGQNILRASAQITDANLAAGYGIIGPTYSGYNDQAPQGFGFAGGSGKAGSYFEDIESANSDQGLAQQHAVYWALRAAGESAKATIVTPSWRDEAGEFWTAGHQVFVQSPFLRLEQYMLIYQVEFRQDGHSGTTATLTLQDPGSYFGTAAGGNGGGWGGVFSGKDGSPLDRFKGDF